MTRGILLVLLVLIGTIGHADGGMFKYDVAADMEPPTIPVQQAYISFDGKKQTLIVASTAKIEGPADIVWVVPVPNVPSKMAAVRPNVFDPLADATKPRFKPGPPPGELTKVLVLGLLLAVGLTVAGSLARKSRKPGAAYLRNALIVALVGIVLWAFYPVFGKASTGAATGTESKSASFDGVPYEGVEIVQRESLGSYDVEVVRGTVGSGLIEWFKANKVHVTGPAHEAILSYMRSGWVFVVAKLRADRSGSQTPHPLRLEFATPEPIYPMRLTGAMGSNVEVELFVLGTGIAQCDQMRYLSHGSIFDESVRDFSDWGATPLRTDPVAKWHSDIADSIGNNAIITRLRATATPRSMRQDWHIRFGPAKWEESRPVDSGPSAQMTAAKIGVTVMLVASFAAGFVRLRRARDSAAAWILVAVLAGSFVGYAVLSQNPGFTTMIPGTNRSRARFGHYEGIALAIDTLAAKNADSLKAYGSIRALCKKSKHLSAMYVEGDESDLTDEKFVAIPFPGGVRIVFQDEYGIRYESILSGITR